MNTKVYHLGFNYGWYDDATEVYLGSYSSEEKRQEAKQRYLDARKKFKEEGEEFRLSFLDLTPQDGNWAEWETQLDVDFYEP